MDTPAQILVVDDRTDNGLLLKKMLQPEGHQVTLVESGPAALDFVRAHPCDLMLLDVMMPGMDGLEVTRRIKADPEHRYIPVLLVTARSDLAAMVSGLDAGADDFLGKPVERRELIARVRAALRVRRLQQELLVTQVALEERHRAMDAAYQALVARTSEKAQLQEEVNALRQQVGDEGRFHTLVGRSPSMRHVFDQLALVAQTDVTVLIRGETGTGKELVARAIHGESARSGGPFVAINCGAVPEGLLESELFGHEKGAFTGATSRKPGRFERAAGGTLFLDEIGDLPFPMQVKLLRVLQERQFERVGGDVSIRADVRIVTATHKNLEEMVAAGELRQDLYYRLNVFPVVLPPLRARAGDIPGLARQLLERLAEAHRLPAPVLSSEAIARLSAYAWPGNVRELENTLERALILSAGGPIRPETLPGGTPSPPHPLPDVGINARSGISENFLGIAFMPDLSQPFKTWKHQLLAHHERRYIVEALRRSDGNMTAAARETGVDAKTFSRKIAEYGIERHETFRPEPGRR